MDGDVGLLGLPGAWMASPTTSMGGVALGMQGIRSPALLALPGEAQGQPEWGRSGPVPTPRRQLTEHTGKPPCEQRGSQSSREESGREK